MYLKRNLTGVNGVTFDAIGYQRWIVKITSLLVAFCLGFTVMSSYADSGVQHLTESEPGDYSPTVPASMNEQIEQAAEEYQSDAPVPRIALTDMAFPSDPEEYTALDGYGVLLVFAVTQENDELPPKRVYVRINDKEVNLKLFASGFEKYSGNKLVNRVFGEYRWDGLYFFPVYFAKSAQTLVIDFAKDRDGFVLQKLGKGNIKFPDFLNSIMKAPTTSALPVKAFTKIVAREYPEFMTSADATSKK